MVAVALGKVVRRQRDLCSFREASRVRAKTPGRVPSHFREDPGCPLRFTPLIGESQRLIGSIPEPAFAESPPCLKALKGLVRAYATDRAYGPGFALFDVDLAFVQRLKTTLALCTSHGLTEARIQAAPAVWASRKDEDDLRLQFPELVITPLGDCWFIDQPKHARGHIETEMFHIDALESALQAALPGQTHYLTNDPEVIQSYLDSLSEAEAPT